MFPKSNYGRQIPVACSGDGFFELKKIMREAYSEWVMYTSQLTNTYSTGSWLLWISKVFIVFYKFGGNDISYEGSKFRPLESLAV